MKLFCPRCKSDTTELMECENCHEIGCHRCMKKSYRKWVCYKCKEPERHYYPETESKEDSATSAFSAMFG